MLHGQAAAKAAQHAPVKNTPHDQGHSMGTETPVVWYHRNWGQQDHYTVAAVVFVRLGKRSSLEFQSESELDEINVDYVKLVWRSSQVRKK